MMKSSHHTSGLRSDFTASVFMSVIGIISFLLIHVVGVFFIVMAPELGLFLLSYAFILVLGLVTLRLAAPLAPLWVRLLIVVVLGDFILSYGFTNFSVGVGSARVTVAELVLLVTLMWIALRSWSAFWITGASAFLIIGYALPGLILHLPMNLSQFGVTAARDALPLVDSLFFFAGVAVVAATRNLEQWHAWRHRFLFLLLIGCLIYLPLYPLQQSILMYSPRVTGFQQSVPLFGYFTTGNVLALSGLMAAILIPYQFSWKISTKASRGIILLAFVVFAIAFVSMQSRATYIVLFVSIIVLTLTGHGLAVRRLFLTVIAIVLTLVMLEVSGLELKGRVGTISLDMIVNQLESATGQGGHEGGRKGVEERLHWWSYSISRWSSSPESIVAGIGFGEALTDFSVMGAGGTPVVVREPHNSYISVLTRTGLVGFILWVIFQTLLILSVWRRYKHYRKEKNDVEANYWLWIFLLFTSILITALVEPVFESPHFAVPYFFLAGLCLGEIARAKNNWVDINSGHENR